MAARGAEYPWEADWATASDRRVPGPPSLWPRRTGGPAFVVDDGLAVDRDDAALDAEFRDVRAYARHGVAHEHEPVVSLCAQRDLQRLRVHVETIDDQAQPAVGVRQRSANRAGLAVTELRHRVEQVREAADTGLECRL
jgi:hypothetical protein